MAAYFFYYFIYTKYYFKKIYEVDEVNNFNLNRPESEHLKPVSVVDLNQTISETNTFRTKLGDIWQGIHWKMMNITWIKFETLFFLIENTFSY